MPRQARLDAPGTLHHVIIRGIERRKIVDDRKDRDRFVLRMCQLAIETGITIYAWSLLTNHAHILLRSGADGLANFMRRFLTGYSITYNHCHNRHGQLVLVSGVPLAEAARELGVSTPTFGGSIVRGLI